MSGGESLNHDRVGANFEDSSRVDLDGDHGRRETIERTGFMGLLPCLRRGSDRWWLPCSPQVTEVLGELLLRSAPNQPTSSLTRRRLHRAVLTDPPLMIFAALNWQGDQAEPMQLVDWLLEHVASRFASGDAYLGEPQVTPEMTRRWNRLRDHFRTIPIGRWIENGAVWLEVSGPTVPNDWQQQWPTFDPDQDLAGSNPIEGFNQPDAPNPPFHLLQQLARLVQHQHSIESAFDHRLHKSKLGALKQLAYGLSHEINNPLANISTRAQQLQRGEEDPARTATLQRIVDQVYRAHEMIADLMFYANPPAIQLGPAKLGELLSKVVASYQSEAQRQAIRLDLNLAEDPCECELDQRMMGEAVGALIRNALEAIGCQGTIVVSLENQPDHVAIRVADSGPGLSPQAREHAFDPYFSGREAGRGLGLGLCRAYRIVQLHRGEISLSGGPAGCVATIKLIHPEQATR